MGCVYFIQAGDRGPVKVGFTGGNPYARMAALQTGHHTRLRLITVVPGGPELEDDLHGYLRSAGLHIRGEWFRDGGALRNAIRGEVLSEFDLIDRDLIYAHDEEPWPDNPA